MKRLILGFGLSVLSCFLVVPFACAKEESPLGVGRDGLAACPSSPNCISTQDKRAERTAEPLKVEGIAANPLECLAGIVRSTRRARVVHADETYVHAEYRSFLGFVDDVEFYFDKERGVIQMRSASRTGYWDMGVNRRRLEAIRGAFSRQCR